jgi:hypothetical protein
MDLTIKLDRPVDRERPCCRNICIVGTAYELTCADCGHRRGRLSPTIALWIPERGVAFRRTHDADHRAQIPHTRRGGATRRNEPTLNSNTHFNTHNQRRSCHNAC